MKLCKRVGFTSQWLTYSLCEALPTFQRKRHFRCTSVYQIVCAQADPLAKAIDINRKRSRIGELLKTCFAIQQRHSRRMLQAKLAFHSIDWLQAIGTQKSQRTCHHIYFFDLVKLKPGLIF